MSLYRSLFLCLDLAGNPIPDMNGDLFQVHMSPAAAQYDRRLAADNAGGFIQALAYFSLPPGDQSLTRFVLATPITLGATERTTERMRLWPNPATDRIHLRLDQEFADDATILLSDAMGRRIPLAVNGPLRSKTGQTLELDVPAHIASGSYSIVIRDDRSRAAATFVVQR